MTKVRLIRDDGTRSYAIVVVPEKLVPKLLRQGDHLFALAYQQGERLVYKETDFLDAFTEEEYERAKQEGLLT